MKTYNNMLENADFLAKIFTYEDIRTVVKCSANEMSDEIFDMYVHALVKSLRKRLLEVYSSQELHPL